MTKKADVSTLGKAAPVEDTASGELSREADVSTLRKATPVAASASAQGSCPNKQLWLTDTFTTEEEPTASVGAKPQ